MIQGNTQQQLSRRIAARFVEKRLPWPSHVDLMLTEDCNHRCGYCFIKQKHELRNMPPEVATAAVDFMWRNSAPGALWCLNLSQELPDGDKVTPTNHGTGSADSVANIPPVANAGSDQPTVEVSTLVTLDGTGSSDADQDSFTYAWTQTSGTPTVTLSNAAAAEPTFTAPASPTTLVFQLVITDITVGLHYHNPGDGESDTVSDTCRVTITVVEP